MRRALLLGAAVVVLVSNGWSVWLAARNRTEARGGTLELTEREVHLQAIPFESSVTVLRLNWRTDGNDAQRQHPPAWLDTNKIAELGFDCSLPLSSPEARRHYESKPSRPVFLTLEYQADTEAKADKPDQDNVRLVVVDAAQSPQQLRRHYPDPQKHVICRGLVRLTFRRHDSDGTPLSTPRLEAWIEGLCPSELSVPKPVNRLLLKFHRTVSEAANSPAGEPRFSARVRWGSNYEPWVDAVRPLSK